MAHQRMIKKLLLIFTCLLATQACAEDSARDVIDKGFSVYMIDGVSAATDVWFKGGVVENLPEVKEQMRGIANLEKLYGSFNGYEIYDEIPITSRLKLFFAVLHFAKGPSYCKFEIYKTESNKWVVLNVSLNTQIENVWPIELFFKPQVKPQI